MGVDEGWWWGWGWGGAVHGVFKSYFKSTLEYSVVVVQQKKNLSHYFMNFLQPNVD